MKLIERTWGHTLNQSGAKLKPGELVMRTFPAISAFCLHRILIGSFWCVTLLWLAVVITLVLVLYGSQGFTGDVRLRPKLTCDALILQKGERDSWIEPVSGVICLLKYTGLVIFLFHFGETSRFPWSIIHKRRDFMFSLLTSWPLFFNLNSYAKRIKTPLGYPLI